MSDMDVAKACGVDGVVIEVPGSEQMLQGGMRWGMEKAIKPKMAAQGYGMRWRFSPGYGDWPLEQQPELIRVTKCESIGITLSESKMLVPRKSVTAIIGLYKEVKGSGEAAHSPNGCAACDKLDCPSRKAVQ